MAGLTDQERQEILSRRQATSPSASGGNFSPFPGMELQGATIGKTPSLRYGQPKSQSQSQPEFLQQQEISSENFSNLIGRLERTYEKAQSVERGPAAIASGMVRTGKAALQLDPDASVYNGLREATLGQSARVISAERGVMTNQDLNRIKSAIPTILTARETGRKQFGELRGITVDVVKTAINRGRKQRGEPLMTDEEAKQSLGFGSGAGVTPSGLKYTIEE